LHIQCDSKKMVVAYLNLLKKKFSFTYMINVIGYDCLHDNQSSYMLLHCFFFTF
jgi:hypothetical protein